MYIKYGIDSNINCIDLVILNLAVFEMIWDYNCSVSDDRINVTEASQCRRLVKNRTSTCSPSITSSIRTMIEKHFDADDEMISVKWKDKEALEGAQG